MTLILVPLLILMLGILFPKFDKKFIGSFKLKEIALPIFVLSVSILDLVNCFSHISDNLIIAYIFMYLISKSSSDYSSYFNKSILLLTIISLVAFGINTIWITFLLLSLVYIEINEKRMLNLVISAIALSLPNFDIVAMLYGQWGGLLLIPAFIGLTTSKDHFIKLICGLLYITIISNTKFTSLGYDFIILIGIALSLLLLQVERSKFKYTVTLGLLPFVGVANPFHIIALYVFVESSIFIKRKTYEIVKRIETENGTIKNIKYQEIAFLIFSMALAFSVPASPLSWLLNTANGNIGFIIMIIVIDLILINQSVIENMKTESTESEKIDIVTINNILFLILLPIVMYKEVISYSYWGILLGLVNLVTIIIFKKKIKWLQAFHNILKGLHVNFSFKVNNTKILNEENKKSIQVNERIMFSGIEETVIWSLFILAISILLIGRYL